ncbi:serine-rich adhesin for platelets-like [Tachysurus vachellii]|uniref:serine-rich adhesin for platelets-like n=1 Tax=Tachysurus vachellii TaxID=175792 RepID=UPI00296AB768|nr:serine-rich adhesin for platelets-like [Tachysurus vachellii]
MWDCKRLWLLFIALLYLKDVRALGVWSKKPAQDWYSIAAQIPQAQPKEPASLHDGAQISTAMRDEGFQSQDIVSYVQATSNQDVSNTALQNSYGTASVTLPSGNTVYSSMYQQRPQVPSTSQTSQSWMQNASSYSSSQSPSVYWQSPSSLSSQYLGSRGPQNVNQVSSASGLTTTQQAASSIVSSGSTSSTSSSSSGSQSPSVYWQSPSSLSSQYLGSRGPQNVNQVSSASGLTTTQQAASSIVSSGSTSSTSSSSSGSQSPSVYWQSPSSLSSQYLGSRGPQNVNQVSSASGLTTTQQAASSIVSSGSTSSTSSSSSGSQSPSVYWQSPSSLSSQYLGSRGPQNVNQVSSASGLTTTQQAASSIVSSGSTSSTSSSSSGSQSPSVYWQSPSSLSSQYLGSRGPQNVNQVSSASGLTTTQQAASSIVSSGSTSSTSSSSSGSQSPSVYWQSPSSLSSQYLGSRGPQNVNQVSSASGLTTTQQAASSIVSSGSTSSTSSSSSGSQSPSVYWPSQSSGINQLSSSPGLTVTQQSMPSVASSGSASSTSSSSSGSQSPSAYWQSASSLSSQYLGSQGQRVNQLTSVPGLTVIQPAFPSLVLSGSTSSSYTGSQGQDSTGYGTFQVLTSQHGSSQTPQGTNQMSSAPSLTVTQLSMPSVASSGSTSSTSSSSSGSQSPSAYWQSASSLSKYFGSQGQQGINQMSSAPGLTVIQPASDSAVSNGSATSVPGSYTSFQSPSTYWQSASSLSSQYLGSQGQRVNQLTPVPGLTVIQPASPSLVSSGSSSSPTGPQSQVSTGYGTFQVLASQHGGFQTPQGTNQMSSAPSLTLIPLSSDTAVTNGSAVGTLSSYGGSQSQGSTVYGLSQGLPRKPGRLQMQLGINQRNSTPVLTTTQQAAPSIVSSGSTSSTSSAYMPSQSQSSTGHGLSQWLVNRYGSFEMWPEQNQQGSAPALTMTQQVVESGMSSGSTTSGISSIGSQSPSTSWLSGISKPTDGTPTLQGLSQPASVAVVTNGSTVSASGSYGVFHIQSPPAYWQSQSSLSSQYLGSQGLQSVNQLSSAPGLTVTQQAAPSVVSSGTTSTSSSPTGFQSQSTSGYWSSQELSNHHDGLQTQGTQQLNQQASSTLTSSSPNVSTSNTTTSNLGIQSKNVQKPQAFNLWMGRYPCKSDSSSNASKLS